jgi:SAM-dependent methyltransferase
MSGDDLRRTYDAVANDYAAHIFDELKEKPFDRQLLDEVAARAADGIICDLGCGPGHVAHYLHERGATVVGIDSSQGMIGEARRAYPDVRFEIGDMRGLRYGDGAFAALVALYSLIHLDDTDLATALREIRRVLAPDGTLLASFHRGDETIHVDEFLGCGVDLDFRFFQPDQISQALADAGLETQRVVERRPYPEVEAQTHRFYVVAVPSDRPVLERAAAT